MGSAVFLVLATALAASAVRTPTAEDVAFVKKLLADMTLEEKVGQMTQPERASCDAATVANLFIGSVLSGGGSVPGSGTAEDWANMYDNYQNAALSTRMKIPLIYGQDAVHGVNNIKGTTLYPHNIALGAANDTDLARRIGAALSEELLGAGSTWTFAPCIAVPRDDRWGRTYEGFGEVPELAERLGAAYTEGVQASGLAQACAKHYLADGGTAWGTGKTGMLDQGDSQIDEATLRALHLPGYRAAIAAGVATVMVSYSSWNGNKLSGSKYLVTDVLKNELGFKGIVVSDYNALQQLPGSWHDQVVASVNAGLDLYMLPTDFASFIKTLTAAVEAGEVPMSRIDDAVERNLLVKKQFGLFDHPYTDRSRASCWGSAEHRAIARTAVQKSQVLLKNTANLLPFRKNAEVFVAGHHANDIGLQCGGWTISWQGQSGAVTTGTTILQGIQSTVTAAGGSVDFNAEGRGAESHHVAIVVVGEKPYAEFEGDRKSLDLDSSDESIVKRVASSGVPIVLVVISGRPVVLPQEVLDDVDAIVAAWLPGTEGAGVADVLFGDAPFTGKLPVSWPRSTEQEPINVGDAQYDPLFPFGFGL